MIKILGLFLLVTISTSASSAEQRIRVNDFNDPNASYAITMLTLAIAHSDNPNYKIDVIKEDFTQARVNEEVRTGGLLDLCWTASDAQIESQLQPIRIPLFKGLLGYRIFIINKNNQTKFDKVKTLDDLKKLTFGQGRTWADGRILEANGFTVIKANKYSSLFYMAEGSRFDGFPRGVHEPFGELEAHPTMDLAVEKNLMVYYQMPFYLFVSPSNQTLAKDLETGFERAIANGEFDKVFYSDKSIQDVLQKANMKNRILFKLENPLLSKETPIHRKELWFDPQSIPDNTNNASGNSATISSQFTSIE